MFLSLVALSGMLFGCANKYANMKIDLSETDIVFYYGGTEDQTEEMTKTFDATVIGAPNGVSCDVVYELSNDIVTLNWSREGNKSTFTLSAKRNAGTYGDLVIKSVESGEVNAVVHLSIVCRVSSLSENPSFESEAFVEVGDQLVSKQIASNAVVFEPNETNQKTVTYSLKQNYEGIQVENGNILIDPQTLPKNITDFEVVATSVENETLSATIKYHIIKRFDVKLKLGEDYLPDQILLTTNTQNSDKKMIAVDVLAEYLNGSDYILDDYTIEKQAYQNSNCTIVDNRELIAVDIGDNNKIAITALKTEKENPFVFLKIWAKVNDYDYQTAPCVVKIQVETVATDISVEYLGEKHTQTINFEFQDDEEPKVIRKSGADQFVDVTSDATFQIYDSYAGEGFDRYGSKFVVSVGRAEDLVANKKFVLYSPDATKFEVYCLKQSGNETIITKINNYIFSQLEQLNELDDSYILDNNAVLYVKALDTTSKSILQIITIDSIQNLQKNVVYTMIFDSTIGVSQITYKNVEGTANVIDNVAFIPVVNFDDKTKVAVEVTGNTTCLVAKASSDIMLLEKQKIVGDEGQFQVVVSQNPKYQNVFGDVIVTLTADNNFSQKFTFRLFAKVSDVKVKFMYDALNRHAINDIVDENGSLTSFALAKGQSESLEFEAYFGNKVQLAKLTKNYNNFDESKISIMSDDIYIKAVGKNEINIEISFVDDESTNGVKTIEKVLTVEGYLAIKSSVLSAEGEIGNKTSFVLYSADSLGKDYIGQVGGEYVDSSQKFNYKKMHLAITFSDGTQFSGQGDEDLSVSWTISANQSNLVAEKVDDFSYQIAKVDKYGTKKPIFVARRTTGTNFEVSALEGLQSSYDVFLSVTITQHGKKSVVQSKFVIQKAVKINQIGNLKLQDNSTGRMQKVTKDALGNVLGGTFANQVYYIYKPFTQVLNDASQYKIFADFLPENPLVKNLNFAVTKIVYDKTTGEIFEKTIDNEVVLTQGVQDCEIKVNVAGTYKLAISAKDSETESAFGNYVYVYLKVANGSEGAEIEIKTAEEFADMLSIQLDEQKNSPNDRTPKYYQIKNDLDLSSINKDLLMSVNLVAKINGQNVGEDGKVFNASITGIDLSKRYEKNTATTENAPVGLFASILSQSQVENLNLIISKVNVIYENVSNAYFGGLAGQNFGKINNVSVKFLTNASAVNAIIVDNAASSCIGGLVGQNVGEITFAYANESIAVCDGMSGMLSVENSTEIMRNTNRFVGGIAGQNDGTIKSEYVFFNNPKPDSNYSSTMSIKVVDNLGDISLGGIVGKNNADAGITGVSFAGELDGIDNVGGVAGSNFGTIDKSFAEAKIVGKDSVGGIAGYSAGKISFSSTMFYSTNDYISGQNYVGGIAGKLENADIEYCYVRSYYVASQGDIRLINSLSSCYAGGLVGCATTAKVSKSYSRAKLFTQNDAHNLGGIVGKGEFVLIENAFERNVYNNLSTNTHVGLDFAVAQNCETKYFYISYQNAERLICGSTDFSEDIIIVPSDIQDANNYYLNKSTYVDLPGDVWYFMLVEGDNNVMADYPFIQHKENNETGTLLTLEQPTEIFVSAQSSDNISIVNENTFVVWRSGEEIQFAEILNVVLSISNSNLKDEDINKLNINQDYFLISNNEKVAIIGETNGAYKLVLGDEGEAMLTITSKANAQLSKTITIFVKDKIDIQESDIQLSATSMFVNKLYQLSVNLSYSDCYIEIFSNDIEQKVAINGIQINSNNCADIAFDAIASIVALEKFDNLTLTFKPYMLYNGQKIYCGEGVEISISSIYGIKSFALDTTFASISPNSSVKVVATATSDDLSDCNIYATVKGFDGNEFAEQNQNSPLYIDINKVSNDSTTEANYEILISINYDNAIQYGYFDQTLTIEFKFVLDDEGLIFEVETLNLELKKLYLQNISMDFYKHIQKLDGDKYGNASEVSSHSIIAGNLGVMQINLTPAQTEIDSVVIYHSQSDQYALNFTQLVKKDGKFVDIGAYVRTAKNGFGIELFKMMDYDGNFDGNVYAGLIISKSVPQNVPFEIYVEVTYNGGYKKLSSVYMLYSEKVSELQIIYDFNGQEYNEGSSVFVPFDIQKTVTIVANEVFTATDTREEIAKAFTVEVNGILTNLSISAQDVSVIGESVVIKFDMTISKDSNQNYKIKHAGQEFVARNVDSADAIDFVAICTRTTSGSHRETRTEKPLKLYPMPFVVKDVQVKLVQNNNGVERYSNVENSLQIKKSISTEIFAKLDCEYSDDYEQEVLEQAALIESSLNSNKDSFDKPQYWILTDTSGSGTEYLSYQIKDNRIVLTGNQVYNDYQFGPSFALTKSDNGTGYEIIELSNINANYGNKVVQALSHIFDLTIYRDVADTDATPIFTSTQLANMKSGNSYRLVPTTLASNAVIELENHVPVDLPENVIFDGNGMTILIKSFYKAYTGSNYGLFASIGKGSIVKNLTIEYDNVSLDLANSDLSTLLFGGIVADNQGVLYNTHATGSITINLSSSVSANIGGIIGSNSGFVSYCSAQIDLQSNTGHVAGFASTNNKKISASKVLVQSIIENSNDKIAQNSSLAGFVARNSGEIDGCYVAGEQAAKLKANAVLAGFVYDNQGTVKNAYTEILVDSARAGGFVYTNSGTITSAYTKLSLTSAEQNSNQIAPFVGVDELSGAVNNFGTIDDCYYYKDDNTNFGSTFTGKQIAKMISSFETSNFAKFIFASEGKDAEYGIWKNQTDTMPKLVEADRQIISKYETYDGYFKKMILTDGTEFYYMVQTIDSNSDDYYQFAIDNTSVNDQVQTNDNSENSNQLENVKPEVNCNYELTTDQEIDVKKVYFVKYGEDNYQAVEELDESNLSTYYEKIEYYGYKNVSVQKVDPEYHSREQYATSTDWSKVTDFGTETNPRLIASQTDWNGDGLRDIQSQFAEKSSYFVLLCDIELPYTPFTAHNYQFAGKLLANNMSVNKLYINESEIGGDISSIESTGLFAELIGSNEQDVLIKGLNISTNYNIATHDIEKVGILTGSAKFATIIDIDISAENSIVFGKNFVGAVAGIMHNSTVVGASISACLNAVYSKAGDAISLQGAMSNYCDDQDSKQYSYAGLIAGVMTSDSNAKLIDITGKNVVIGYNVGLAVGLVDGGSQLCFASAQIVEEQFVKGYVTAGGLVGENRGLVTQSKAFFDENSQRNLTFFAGNPFFAGGLVGFNNGGEIKNCISTIDVRAEEQQLVNSTYVVGGLVGLANGGTIECCYVTGSVRGQYILGGLVGAVSRRLSLQGDKELFASDSAFVANKKLSLTNCFAYNQWISSTNTADDSHYISDTRLKGTIFGAIVDSDFNDITITNFIDEFENVYFNTADSDYRPNPADTDTLNGTFTAGKFMRAFGATAGAKQFNFDQFKIEHDGIETDVNFDENNLIKICSIGGFTQNFDTTATIIVTKENYRSLLGDGIDKCFANAFVGGALICNANNGDYQIVYGPNGVYEHWDKSIFNLPYDEKSAIYHQSIYPSLIVNINN